MYGVSFSFSLGVGFCNRMIDYDIPEFQVTSPSRTPMFIDSPTFHVLVEDSGVLDHALLHLIRRLFDLQ